MKRDKIRLMLPTFMLLIVFVLSGCSKSDRAWKDAKALDTIEAYQTFQQSYPNSAHRTEAAEAIRLLRWQQAVQNDSVSHIEAYISDYPEAPNIEEARNAYAYLSEIGALKDRIKDFLNGDADGNTISILNGQRFVAKDRGQSPDKAAAGTSSMRVSLKITNPQTQKVLSCVFRSLPDQIVERVESIEPSEGASIDFLNGHQYVFTEGRWRKNG